MLAFSKCNFGIIDVTSTHKKRYCKKEIKENKNIDLKEKKNIMGHEG